MSYGSLVYWGCSREGRFDLFNCARTDAYLREHYPQFSQRQLCCPPGLEGWLPQPGETEQNWALGPYTNPVDDRAWWYDPERPESAGFLGFQITKWGGMFEQNSERTASRSSNAGCGDKLTFSERRNNGRTVVVEAIAYGLTCCSTAYGIQALTQTLRECCSDSCVGTSIRMLSCIPQIPLGCSPDWQPPAETTSPWRTASNVSVMDEPAIIGDRDMPSCGCACAPATRIRFTLQMSPGLMLDKEVFVPTTPIVNGPCEILCTIPCVETPSILLDPDCPEPLLPEPRKATNDCYCPPLFGHQNCFEVDLGNTRMFETQLELRICAGIEAIRNLRIKIWKQYAGLPYESGFYTDCNACVDIGISYIPPGGCWNRTACKDVRMEIAGQSLEASNTLFESSPASKNCMVLPCGVAIVCILADGDNISPDATFEMSLIEIEP